MVAGIVGPAMITWTESTGHASSRIVHIHCGDAMPEDDTWSLSDSPAPCRVLYFYGKPCRVEDLAHSVASEWASLLEKQATDTGEDLGAEIAALRERANA